MNTQYEQAVELANRSRYDLAERLLRQALAEEPEHAGAHSLLGVCLAQLDRGEEAVAAANEGLRLDPSAAYSYYARALVLHGALKPALAAKDMEDAIRIDPTDPDYCAFLARIYEDQLKFRKSLSMAERGLAIDPNHPHCSALRASALRLLGRRQEAEQTLARAIEHSPDDTDVHAELGWEHFDNENREVARGHFLESLRINPNNGQAHYGLAWVNFWSLSVGRRVFVCIKFLLLALLVVVLATGFGTARLIRKYATRVASFVAALAKGARSADLQEHGRSGQA
jgi:tetratricopeptide (TPR) repeat protein